MRLRKVYRVDISMYYYEDSMWLVVGREYICFELIKIVYPVDNNIVLFANWSKTLEGNLGTPRLPNQDKHY